MANAFPIKSLFSLFPEKIKAEKQMCRYLPKIFRIFLDSYKLLEGTNATATCSFLQNKGNRIAIGFPVLIGKK